MQMQEPLGLRPGPVEKKGEAHELRAAFDQSQHRPRATRDPGGGRGRFTATYLAPLRR